MGLKTACDGCGRGVSGVSTRLTKVRGKYLCPDCAENPDGTLRYYCTSCHHFSATARRKGNGLIEAVLYLAYIVPGVIYSIWRRSGNTRLCPKCGGSALIDASAGTHVRCPECRELVQKDARRCKHCGVALKPEVA